MNTFTEELIRKTDFQASPEQIRTWKAQWQQYAAAIKPYPGNFEGRGIVICAGGISYFTCAWINITLLRRHGCTLPIEVWHTQHELNEEVIAQLALLGVECKNCMDYTAVNIESVCLKPFAVLHSKFREVLYLDADNNCITDPAYLFDSDEYQDTGTLFWPDFWTTDRNNPIWEVTGATDFSGIEQESGQILINKEQCWKELNLCLYFNFNHEHYYRMLLGDKDTFKFAWQALGTKYYMIPSPVGFCGFNEPGKGFCGLTMVQHDVNGNILFFHRNWFKWDITQEDEAVWMEIKRFRQGAVVKTFAFNYLVRGSFKFKFWDINGDIEQLSFRGLFGDFELECLAILKDLRSRDFYARFLLHSYFVHFRPGYANGYAGKIFSWPPQLTNAEALS